MGGAAVASIVMDGMRLTQDSISQNISMDLQKRQQQLSEHQTLLDMLSQYDQNKLGVLQEQANVQSYDKWLANYGAQYKQETDTKLWQGRETYENFLNAIGYGDALAGATGRIGAGTSMGEVTKEYDRKLVDYVGEDRKLDNQGGTFGQELSQMQLDLEFQRQEMTANRNIAQQSIGNYERANTDLEDFISKNFSTDWNPDTSGTRYLLSALTGNLSEFLGFGDKVAGGINKAFKNLKFW